jgi:hypothetical protein
MKMTITAEKTPAAPTPPGDFTNDLTAFLRKHGYRLTAWEIEYQAPSATGSGKSVLHRVMASQ